MEMIAEDLLNRGLKKDGIYQQMGLAVSKEEISPKIQGAGGRFFFFLKLSRFLFVSQHDLKVLLIS